MHVYKEKYASNTLKQRKDAHSAEGTCIFCIILLNRCRPVKRIRTGWAELLLRFRDIAQELRQAGIRIERLALGYLEIHAQGV